MAHVLILSGVLLIADAGATLAWQEPVTAFMTQRQQATLKRALEDPPRRVIEKKPLEGDAIGKIEFPTLDKSLYVVEGTDRETLRKGPGHYPKTPLPGERGTVGIAGHRTTNGAPFRKIDQLKRGDPIIVSMPYGRYVYRVEKTKIVDPSEISVTRKVAYNRLILSACHPLYSAAERIVVFARETRKLPTDVRKRQKGD